MSLRFAGWNDQTIDLAVERFTVGLAPQDAAELDRTAEQEDLDDFEVACAAIHLAFLPKCEPAPKALISNLEDIGRRQIETQGTIPAPAPATQAAPASAGNLLQWSGWIAAAAALVLLFLSGQEQTVDPRAQRDTLVASAQDVLRIDWTTTEDPAAEKASGDVVWSRARQEGYMRFAGLEANDPTKSQYQLWIFDKTRADWEAKPVDGGVFNVGASGEVVVPIDAKLEVSEAALFAVTIEAPGGVVVSERERIVVTAAPTP